jgi:hypothetical protein
MEALEQIGQTTPHVVVTLLSATHDKDRTLARNATLVLSRRSAPLETSLVSCFQNPIIRELRSTVAGGGAWGRVAGSANVRRRFAAALCSRERYFRLHTRQTAWLTASSSTIGWPCLYHPRGRRSDRRAKTEKRGESVFLLASLLPLQIFPCAGQHSIKSHLIPPQGSRLLFTTTLHTLPFARS